jgi:hypothetical protein
VRNIVAVTYCYRTALAALLVTSSAVAAPSPSISAGSLPDSAEQHCSQREMCPGGTLCTTSLTPTEPSHEYTECARRGFGRGLVRRCSHANGSTLQLLLCPRGQAGKWPGSAEIARTELTTPKTTQPAEASPAAPPVTPSEARLSAHPAASALSGGANRADITHPEGIAPFSPGKRTTSLPQKSLGSSCSASKAKTSCSPFTLALWGVGLLFVLMRRKPASVTGQNVQTPCPTQS